MQKTRLGNSLVGVMKMIEFWGGLSEIFRHQPVHPFRYTGILPVIDRIIGLDIQHRGAVHCIQPFQPVAVWSFQPNGGKFFASGTILLFSHGIVNPANGLHLNGLHGSSFPYSRLTNRLRLSPRKSMLAWSHTVSFLVWILSR